MLRQSLILAALFSITVSHGAERSAAAKYQFKKQTGYLSGRPGYVIDHIIPLCAGGPDTPENMQWQTIAEAKIKDKDERATCKKMRAEENKPPLTSPP